jgi:uncharacterized protein YjdB
MARKRKMLFKYLLGIFFTLVMWGFSNHVAEASAPTLPSFHFQIGSKNVINGSGTYDLKTSTVNGYVLDAGGIMATSITWESSEPGVVSIPSATASTCTFNREGPGYSTITATITQGGFPYVITFVMSVSLEIDQVATKTQISSTTNSRVLVLDTINQTKPVFVKYLDYTDESPAVSGAAIATTLLYQSDNIGVATVDEKGVVKAVGAGSATITVSSITISPLDKPMTVDLRIVVTPTFKFTYTDSDDNTITNNSVYPKDEPGGVYKGVPSDFVLDTNATDAKNLVWVVYNVVNDTRIKIAEGTTSKMTYTVNASDTVSFENVKTGTYEIFAFTNKDYDQSSSVPFAYMKIYVPIAIRDASIIMNVGDTYSLLDNSNITDTKLFIEPNGYETNIALFNMADYTITARRQGTTTINFLYDPDQKLYDTTTVTSAAIKVTVIDGIALSTSKATIFTKGKLQLQALVTDQNAAVTWSSSNTSIATVVSGLVTGVKDGLVTITAKQKINGVYKTATCQITVQASVDTITVTPNKSTLAINAFLVLHATITPTSLTGVVLHWKSSDESIVTVVEADTSALTATVQGLTGGHAVISAINQDNVVVGYCDITVQQPVVSIELSETAATVNQTQKILQLRATVYPDNAVNKQVLWSTTDSSIAKVDENGLVTFVKTGRVTIIATSADNPAAVAYCTLNIQVPVKSIALDETMKTMYVGESARMTYIVLPTDASNNVVSWVSTNTSVVAVDASGKVSAKGVGTAVIILKTADGGFSTYCTIVVKMVATTIKFDVANLGLKTGEYYVLKTTLTPKGSTENDITWESSDTKVATVDSEGKIVAKTSGTCIIMARTVAGGVAYCTVTVTQGVTGLVLNFADKTIFKGESFTLEASISPTSATKLEVTWKSSNTKVATIDSKGVVTGIVGGVVVITCTTTDGGYAATCVLTVKETVTKITLNYEIYNLGINKKVKLIATVSTETATNQKVTWESSNEKIAIVSSSGKVTGLKTGYVTITATAEDGSEVEASCELRVVTLVTSVTLSKTTMAMFVGESKVLKASTAPTKATIKKAKWSTSDVTIAIVDEDGTVIGIKAGSVMITAEAQDSSGKKAICYVTVYDRMASTGVTLMDKKITMVPGETKMVEMVLIPTASTDSVTWSSDNTAVASVNKDSGKITAKAPGTVYISVMTDSGKTATVEVTVIGLNVNEFVAEQYTDYGQALTVEGATGTVVWQSSNPLIATVSSDGTIGGRGIGTATITATVNGRKLTCKVTVIKMTS